MRKLASYVLAVPAVMSIVVVLSTTVAGAAPRSIGVSVPADPIPAIPGRWVALPLRVTNPGATPVAVHIEQRALELGDNGRISVLTGPDPSWAPQLQVPPGPVDVPAQGYAEVSLNLRVPNLAPDTYLVGFLVTPMVPQSGIQVVNAIGTYFAVDIPGPRDRRIAASLHAPAFVWGNSAQATVTVSNIGHSSVSFWGEAGSQRVLKTFLPSAHHRSVTVATSSHFGLGKQTVTVHLFYNGTTDAQVREVTVSGTTWFVAPLYPIVAAGLVLVVLAVVAVRRRIPRTMTRPTAVPVRT